MVSVILLSDGRWKTLRLFRNWVPLTHLFFTDDILFPAEASCDQVTVFNSILDVYCHSLVAKVNRTKTHVFFCENVTHGEANNIGQLLGFTTIKDLRMYL